MKDYFVLKEACRRLFLAGVGDLWFEEGAVGNGNGFFYKLCSKTMLLVYIFMTIQEILAMFLGDFPEDEKSDATTFALSHTLVLVKIFVLIFHKKHVKRLSHDLIKVCEKHEDYDKMETKYKMIRINVIAYYCSVYGSSIFFVFEGLRKLYLDGTHFVTVVTYYPNFDNNSNYASIARVVCTIILYIMMMPMLATDCLAMTLLITIKYKFITLRSYFEGLKEKFYRRENSTSTEEASKDLKNGIVEGIRMHQELLRVTKNVDESFGLIIALQVCLSFASEISLLLQLALNDQLSFTGALKIVFFMLAVLFLLALFLCNAGEITYQASLLSDSIFHCGWHACSGNRHDVGKLVLLSCTVAQQPPVMKAFKMLDLTYGTFLTVVRAIYSVYALIYARKKE